MEPGRSHIPLPLSAPARAPSAEPRCGPQGPERSQARPGESRRPGVRPHPAATLATDCSLLAAAQLLGEAGQPWPRPPRQPLPFLPCSSLSSCQNICVLLGSVAPALACPKEDLSPEARAFGCWSSLSGVGPQGHLSSEFTLALGLLPEPLPLPQKPLPAPSSLQMSSGPVHRATQMELLSRPAPGPQRSGPAAVTSIRPALRAQPGRVQ